MHGAVFAYREAERLPHYFGPPLHGRTPLTGLSSPVYPAEEEVTRQRFIHFSAPTTSQEKQPEDPARFFLLYPAETYSL